MLMRLLTSKMIKNLNEFLFIVASITFTSDLFILHCPPVQENSSAVIKTEINISSKALNIYLFRSSDEFFSCNEHNCFPTKNSFTFNYFNETNKDTYILTIELLTNISWRIKQESALGEWKVNLQDNGDINCDLKVYAIYGEPSCSYDNRNVTCSINKVYPKAACQFNGTFGKGENEITYEHIAIENETYYNTSCTFRIEAANENQDITVTIYPNVTGKSTDSHYGKTITLNGSDLCTTAQLTTTIQHSTVGSNHSTNSIIAVTNATQEIPTNIENISLNLIAATSLCAFIFVGIVVCFSILLIRRKRGYIYKINKNTSTDRFGKNHIQVTEFDNFDIYNLVGFANPKCPSKLIDPYSTVEELYSQSNKVRDSKKKNDNNVITKTSTDPYSTVEELYSQNNNVRDSKEKKDKNVDTNITKNSTGLQNTRRKETNAHKQNKAPTLSKETTNPIQIKRVAINDSQYTLVNKEGEKIKTQNNQDVYSNVDIIKTGSTTSLATTINHLPKSLKRVIFNKNDYTFVDKPPKLIGTSK